MKKLTNKFIIVPIVFLLLSIGYMAFSQIFSVGEIKKSYNDFKTDLTSNNVSEVYITSSPDITVKLKDSTIYKTDNPKSDNFKEELLVANVKVLNRSLLSVYDILPKVIFVISLSILIIMLVKTYSPRTKGLLSVDRLEADADHSNSLTFNDVAGNEEAKESVQDIIDFLKNPEKYKNYGARMPKGIILYGEPGTGKTLIAKAVAGEANVPFYAMSGSDFIQVYVGVGASRIRQLFKKARGSGKAVIFIDEIDAIGKKRSGSSSGGSDERDQTLNALLTEMSGFNEKEGIIVMAATNRLDILDSALLRPGRFDRHIEITLPDVLAREKILNLYLEKKPIGDIDITTLAKKTSYFSGAKLENLVNEAAILACKDDSDKISEKHFDKAFSIVVAGHEKQNRSFIKDHDRKITAYHEIGHALINSILLPDDEVSKVSIIPTTKGAGGYTLSVPQDNMYQNKDYLRKRIMVLLGGRAAEEITFGKEFITTGASNDLKVATEMITSMISIYGMGESIGLISLNGLPQEYVSAKSSTILDECKATIEDLYEESKNLLKAHITELTELSNLLIEKEVIYKEDIQKYIN
ncbi:MAG: ATP-dependent metallopeptidase FtsH/Yme1/Tma family protein [Clostridiaceae bacterium]